MKPPKKVKAVKAWAVVNQRGKIRECISTGFLAVFPRKNYCNPIARIGERVIPVLITPLSERGK